MDTTEETTTVNAPPARVDNPFGRPLTTSVTAQTDQARAVTEVQGAMLIAKRFPRDPVAAMDRILNACTRPSLADAAVYEYSKGGSKVAGASIRLAEVLAQSWGNIQCGVRELETRAGESSVEAFAWDVETGFRDSKTFTVPHLRYVAAKNGKPSQTYKLEDPREVYEHVANMGARRKRACILATIPGDVVEAAIDQCEKTQALRATVTPERLKEVAEAFAEFGVTVPAIEKRIQRRFDTMTPGQMVNLRKIITSMRDAMSKPTEWFDMEPTQATGETPTQTGADAPTRGAAGLKAGAAKAAASAKPATDATPPKRTLAQVTEAMNKATTRDQLDEAALQIPMIESSVHQEEAQQYFLQRKGVLDDDIPQ